MRRLGEKTQRGQERTDKENVVAGNSSIPLLSFPCLSLSSYFLTSLREMGHLGRSLVLTSMLRITDIRLYINLCRKFVVFSRKNNFAIVVKFFDIIDLPFSSSLDLNVQTIKSY